MRKSMLFVGSILCLLLLCCLSYQPAIAYENENPRYHYNVKIIMITKLFDSILINGFHDEHIGWGYDELIKLEEANKLRIFGYLQIFNDSTVLEYNNHGGWIHTNIEITGFTGFMMNQNTNFHVMIVGECEMVKLTTGRS